MKAHDLSLAPPLPPSAPPATEPAPGRASYSQYWHFIAQPMGTMGQSHGDNPGTSSFMGWGAVGKVPTQASAGEDGKIPSLWLGTLRLPKLNSLSPSPQPSKRWTQDERPIC